MQHISEPESSQSLAAWAKLLEPNAEHSKEDIHEALLLGMSVMSPLYDPLCMHVHAGVPPSCREEAWQLLSNLYQARNKPDWRFPAELEGEEAFHQLDQETTEYQHSIEVDLSKCTLSLFSNDSMTPPPR